MKRRFDFSKGRPNPYVKRLKKQITLRLDESIIAYFKQLSNETAIPYQTLMNLYLRECAVSRRQLKLEWPSAKARAGAA
ncbi:MAG: BrnA antitoxin family protein [Thermoanaerobaculia bacterium]